MPSESKTSLAGYQAKRDFSRTPEPVGKTAHPARTGGRFVIHEHHASHLHWDLRLEHKGVLVSWAIPKGIPQDPKRNVLAVHTEDHPLEYFDFQGTIPEGNYGAGEMYIWDQGTYGDEKFSDNKVIVTLHGKQAKGKYALFQTGGKNWMIHRMDPPLDPAREPFPESIVPMVPRIVKALPKDKTGFTFETDWGGLRTLAFVSGGQIRLQDGALQDVTEQFPEFRKLGESLGAHEVVLDGALLTLDAGGRPDQGRLKIRLGDTSPSAIRRHSRDAPAMYVISDLLFQDGRSLLGRPYAERRKQLEVLRLNGPTWQAALQSSDSKALRSAAKQLGFPGIIAKRTTGIYEPGKLSADWLREGQ